MLHCCIETSPLASRKVSKLSRKQLGTQAVPNPSNPTKWLNKHVQSNMYLGLPGALRAGLNQLSLRHPKLRHYQLQPQHQWRLRQAHQQWCPARHHSNQYVYQESYQGIHWVILVSGIVCVFSVCFFLKFPVLSMFPAICSILGLEAAISRVFAEFLSSNWSSNWSSNSHVHLHMFATFWCSTCSCNIW